MQFTPIRVFTLVVLVLITFLQYKLWGPGGGYNQIEQYQQRIEGLEIQIQSKKDRNEGLYAEILDLKKGQDAFEERARYELGMIQPNETFFQILQ